MQLNKSYVDYEVFFFLVLSLQIYLKQTGLTPDFPDKQIMFEGSTEFD